MNPETLSYMHLRSEEPHFTFLSLFFAKHKMLACFLTVVRPTARTSLIIMCNNSLEWEAIMQNCMWPLPFSAPPGVCTWL